MLTKRDYYNLNLQLLLQLARFFMSNDVNNTVDDSVLPLSLKREMLLQCKCTYETSFFVAVTKSELCPFSLILTCAHTL